jgi:predicted DNA-binding transcriptional regulator YafY
MYHPTTRVLTILELLQSRQQMSATELAERLEVDTRTVRRYVMMLQDMGIPVETEMGRYGGYSLRPGYKLPPLMFNDAEVLALVLGLLVVRKLELQSAAYSVDGALAKLERVLPDALREQVQALQSSLVVNMPAPDGLIHASTLTAISTAIHRHQQVEIEYHKDRKLTCRTIDPYGLAYHDRSWYVVGYCHLRAATRVFRLDRIASVSIQPDTFTPPANFDSLAYLIESFANMPDLWHVDVLLKTTQDNAAAKLPAGFGVVEPHDEGVLLRTAVSDLDMLARFLVNLAIPMRVIDPPELRTALENLIREIQTAISVS